MISLTVDTKDFQRQLSSLDAFPKEAEAAVYQAVKRTIKGVHTQILKEISDKSTLTQRKVSAAVGKESIINKGSTIKGMVFVSSEAMHLSDYQITPKGRATAQKGKRPSKWRPVRWRIEKGKAFKTNRREDGFSKAFAAYAKSGKLIVFRRKDGALHAQFGPRVQYFMAFDRVQKPLEELAMERFEKNLRSEINYRLGKLGAR